MIADRVVEAVEKRLPVAEIRQAARWTALSRYSLDRCLPRQIEVLNAVAARRRPEPD